MATLRSWLAVNAKSHFSLNNLPFGIISTTKSDRRRCAVAIGDYALDLHAFAQGNGFAELPIIQPFQDVFSQPTLNAFAALGRPMHRHVREFLQRVLAASGPFSELLEKNPVMRQNTLVHMQECTMHLPMHIGDYTDFYAGLNHAHNVGVLFRGPQNALQPNYKHLPVGYHGRASSVVVSGTPIRRPVGQVLSDPTAQAKLPILQASGKLDFELELGCFICKPSSLGERIELADAANHLFGLVLMNDWSARDIQAWEYVPLGPFNSKNFATTISPWVVLMDALEPFATHGLVNDAQLLPYLDERGQKTHFPIDLSVAITPSDGASSTICKTSATNLIFSFTQMLAHHTVGGCPFNVGDLMGSGTISGTGILEKGALLEQTENGKQAVSMINGETRLFLEDGDEVVMSGVCGNEDSALVGFGECSGVILAARETKA